MSPLIWVLATTFTAVVPAPVLSTAPAEEVEAAGLLNDPDEWDGARVAIVGELVGDYSHRDDGVWVQINDDAFVGSPVGAGGDPQTTNMGVGALIPAAEFEEIHSPPGRYGRHGPVVRLEGTFRHSDPDLGGETYLEVDTVRTLQQGNAYPTPGPDLWLGVGTALLLIAGVVTWAGRRQSGAGG